MTARRVTTTGSDAYRANLTPRYQDRQRVPGPLQSDYRPPEPLWLGVVVIVVVGVVGTLFAVIAP